MTTTLMMLFGVAGFFFGFLPCGFGGVFLYEFLLKKYITDKGIMTEKDGATANEIVHDFLIAGWSLKQPQA